MTTDTEMENLRRAVGPIVEAAEQYMQARVFGNPATAKRTELERAAMLAVAEARAEVLRPLPCDWTGSGRPHVDEWKRQMPNGDVVPCLGKRCRTGAAAEALVARLKEEMR